MRTRLGLLLALTTIPLGLWAAPLRVSMAEQVRQFESQRRNRWFELDADSVHAYDQLALSLDYQVEDASVPATGWAHVTLVGREAITQIIFNAELQVLDVQEQGAPVPHQLSQGVLLVNRALNPGDTITLSFQVSVPRVQNAWEVGYHVRPDHVYTFAEPFGARRWFPCWDQPFDKFSEVTIAINMPDYWKLAANGLLIETTYPSSGRKREVYYHDYPISTYLVMIAAGDYARRYETAEDVLYRYVTFYDDSLDAVYDWERTPLMTEFFEQSFGEYPFGQYGMVQTDLNGGAMEHQTMTTMGRNLVTGNRAAEGVVVHELAHQWFGDDLSPVDFRNIWLNEGFATYSMALFYQHQEGQELFRAIMENDARLYFEEDNWRRYAAYDPPPELMFGRVEYQKAGWVLHMLREQLLGDSLFFATLRNYVAQFRAGTVNTEDFINVVNLTTGLNLHWFFDQWIYQAGHPELQIWLAPGVPTSRDVTVTINQIQTNAPIFRFPLEVDVTTVEGTTTHQFWFNEQSQSVTQSFPADVQNAVLRDFQPLLWEGAVLDAEEPERPVAREFALGAVYPNPFNAMTRIPFEIPVAANVQVGIYDLQGRLVQTLAQGLYPAGRHELTFSPGPQQASGIYWISLQAGDFRKQVKAVLLR